MSVPLAVQPGVSMSVIHDVMGFVADDTNILSMRMTLSLGLLALPRCPGRNCLTPLSLRVRGNVLSMW
jgi:hypothetical protein